jgi:hypothetical protein
MDSQESGLMSLSLRRTRWALENGNKIKHITKAKLGEMAEIYKVS